MTAPGFASWNGTTWTRESTPNGNPGGFNNLSGLKQSLQEEETMARSVADLVEPVTRKYIELYTRDLQSKL